MSPATSTALPLLASTLARRARSMPAMPIAARSAPIVVGIRHTSRPTSVGTSVPRLLIGCGDTEIRLHVVLGVEGHRPQGGRHDQEDQREGRQHEREGDLVGRALADGPLDEGDHAVEKRAAGAGRDPHDDPVGEDARAAGHAGAVAARFANDGGRFARDGRLVDRGDPLDDLAVAGNELSRLDDDHGRPP